MVCNANLRQDKTLMQVFSDIAIDGIVVLLTVTVV